MHIRNILADGELDSDSTVKKYLTVQTEKDRQVRRNIRFYNLDMILAIGYKVRSERGTQFRIWATQNLSEYLKKGFVLDKQRLKGSDKLTDYFDDLLAQIREIRTVNRGHTKECAKSLLWLQTITPKAKPHKYFLPLCRTRCSMPPQATPQQR
jgi:hypothetical protein